MKKFITLSVISALSLISCTRETSPVADRTGPLNTDSIPELVRDETNQKSIHDFTFGPSRSQALDKIKNNLPGFSPDDLKQVPQNFYVNVHNDTMIAGIQGTEIGIPSESFEYADGRPLNSDSVKLQLKEFYSYRDMLLEGLTTQTDTGTLRSAGMIKIDAFAGNEPLQLKEGTELVIRFNNHETADDFGLYYGEEKKDGEVQWSLDPLGAQPAPQVVQTTGKFTGYSDSYFEKYYRLKKETAIALQDKYWEGEASFNAVGDVIGRTVYGTSSFDKGVERAEASVKFDHIISGIGKFLPNTSFPSMNTVFGFTCMDKKAYLQKQAEMGMNSMVDNFVLNNIASKQNFFARKLGYLNCDANLFVAIVSIPLKMILKAGDDLIQHHFDKVQKRIIFGNGYTALSVGLNASKGDSVNVRLAYKDMKSIIMGHPDYTSGTCSFAGLPAGRDLYVVATKKSAAGLFIAIEKVNVKGDHIFVPLNYKEYKDPDSVRAVFSDIK